MKSLTAGFDVVSNHLSILLFSLTLDLFIWFGPRLSLSRLFEQFFARALLPTEFQEPDVIEYFRTLASDYNLLAVLRTIPIGIPSLMAPRAGVEIPIGQPVVWEFSSWQKALVAWLLLTLVGLLLGAFYFTVVSQAILSEKMSFAQILKLWPWASVQVLFLTGIWFILLFLIMLPLGCVFSVLFLTGINIDQLALFIALLFGGLLIWLLVPFVFSPHGIFVNRRPVWMSIWEGYRVARMTLPTTSLMLLVIFILSEGLDILWNIPSTSSWLALVGVGGHGFVAASLLAASFIYYKDADHWVKNILQRPRLNIA